MIAKLITYGKDRTEAIELMQKALRDYKLVGFNNNLRFLKRVFDNAVFQQGDYDTGFIEQNINTLLHKSVEVDTFDLVTAVVARSVDHARKINLPKDLINFRNVKNQKELQKVTVHDTSLSKDLHWDIEVEKLGAHRGVVTINGKAYNYQIQSSNQNQLTLVVNGQIRHQEYFV